MAGIHVTSEALQAIHGALGTFEPAALQSLIGPEVEFEEISTEVRMHLQRLELRRVTVEQQLSAAQAALSQCLSSGYKDEKGNYHAPDCSREQSEVGRLGNLLSRISGETAAVRQLEGRANGAASAVRSQGRRFEGEVRSGISGQQRFLGGAAADLARLNDIQTPSLSGLPALGERANAERAETDRGRGNPEARG